MNKLYFNIDWGETIGFSVIDETGNIVLTGQNTNENVVLNVFYSLLPDITVFSYERLDLLKADQYSSVIHKALQLCSEYDTRITELNPVSWKHSHVAKLRRTVSKHELESYRQAVYSVFK